MIGRGTSVVVAAALLLAPAGCRSKSKSQTELQLAARNRDAAPVVVVDRPGQGMLVGPLDPEVEPNDRRDKAQPVKIPGGVQGHLTSAGDIDFFRFEPAEAGMVRVELSGPAAKAGGVDLVLTLYDADGKRLARSDRGPAGTLEGLPNYGLAAGKTYYLSVSQFVRKHRRRRRRKKRGAPSDAGPGAGAGAPYQLSIAPVHPAPSDEVEPNDKIDGAREVLLSDQVSGTIGWSGDVDLWKLSLSGFSGGYGLDVAVGGVDGVVLTVDIVDPDGALVVSRKGQKGRGVLVRGLLPPTGVPYFVARVSGSRSNPEQPYRLEPTTRSLDPDDETEPNDDEAHANPVGPISAGQQGQRRGAIDGGDMDMYRLDGGAQAVDLAISVDPPRTVDAVLRVLRPGGAEVARSDGGKAGQREQVSGVPLRPGQVLYVAVSGPVQGDERTGYVLRWSATGAAAPAPAPPPPPTAPEQDQDGDSSDSP